MNTPLIGNPVHFVKQPGLVGTVLSVTIHEVWVDIGSDALMFQSIEDGDWCEWDTSGKYKVKSWNSPTSLFS